MITPNNQVTLNQIISILKGIRNNYPLLKDFYCGRVENLQSRINTYPLMYVFYDGGNIKLNEVERNISIAILDKLETDYTNEDEVNSDTELILQDIKAILKFSNPFNQLLRINDDVHYERVGSGINSDIVCGNRMDLKIRTDYVSNLCNIPGVIPVFDFNNYSNSNQAARPYKIYTALLTQSGTDAPTALILENSLGGDITFQYYNPGQYTMESSGLFTANKTVINLCQVANNDLSILFSVQNLDENRIYLNASETQTGNFSDNEMQNIPIIIKVYY